MVGHSIVWLAIGVVAFGYWLRAVEFFPNRSTQEYAGERKDLGYNQSY